jgi:hypothetical protein
MSNEPKDQEISAPLKVRRGRVASVDLYEIKDSELDLLEGGSPATLQLNFAIFVLSLAFSAVCALCTATFSNKTVETIFLVVAIGGVLFGAYLLLCWWRSRVSIKAVCRKIRERIPPDVVLAPKSTAVPGELPAEEDEKTQPEG